MPALESVMSDLNVAFSRERIRDLAKRAADFAPGSDPIKAGHLTEEGTVLHRALEGYIGVLPGAFHVTVRSLMHYALTSDPPIPVTFAWAPGYDFELTVWHVPDAPPTRGGITILVKSRYPGDRHPLHK